MEAYESRRRHRSSACVGEEETGREPPTYGPSPLRAHTLVHTILGCALDGDNNIYVFIVRTGCVPETRRHARRQLCDNAHDETVRVFQRQQNSSYSRSFGKKSFQKGSQK